MIVLYWNNKLHVPSDQLAIISENTDSSKLCHKGENTGIRIEIMGLNLNSNLY